MAEPAVQLDDGMTDAERHFFQSGGDVNEDLLKQQTPPPEPAPAPTPEPVAEAAAAAPAEGDEEIVEDTAAAPQPGQPDQQQQRQRRRVSMREYQAAEQRAAAAERQLQEQTVKNARIDERLTLLQQALQEPAQPEQPEADDPRPDPQQDVFAHIAWQERQINKLNAQLTGTAQKVNDYEQQITTGQAEMDAERRYFDSLNTFAGTRPDFVNAYNTAIRGRAAQLIGESYPDVTDEQLDGVRNGTIRIPQPIADQLRQEERGLYKTAFEQNRDPAAVLYRYAQSFGYRPTQQQQPSGNGAAQPQQRAAPPLGGAAPRPAAPAAPTQPTATDVVNSIQRGQSAAMSLSNAGGAAADIGQLTPEQLANMPEEQFAAILDHLQATNPARVRELMGA